MQSFKLKKGLDLPVLGAPVQEIKETRETETVAVLAADYVGLKPRLLVQEGDVVGVGAPLFFHKDTPDVMVTSPASGRVRAVNRGARRVLISVEIEVDKDAAAPVDFSAIGDATTAEGLTERLCASGLWTSFRTRPYSKVPDPAARPAAIFVTAMDTEPLAADPTVILAECGDDFAKGLEAVASLSGGKTYLCHETGAHVPGQDVAGIESSRLFRPASGRPRRHAHAFPGSARNDKNGLDHRLPGRHRHRPPAAEWPL